VVVATVVVGWVTTVVVSGMVTTGISVDGAADEGSGSWLGFSITLAADSLWATGNVGGGSGVAVEWVAVVATEVTVWVHSVSWFSLSLGLALAQSVDGTADVGSARWVGSDAGGEWVTVVSVESSDVWVEGVSWLSLCLSLSIALAKMVVCDQWSWPASVASGLESGSAHAGPVLLVKVAVAIVAWLSSDGGRQSKENNEKLHNLELVVNPL